MSPTHASHHDAPFATPLTQEQQTLASVLALVGRLGTYFNNTEDTRDPFYLVSYSHYGDHPLTMRLKLDLAGATDSTVARQGRLWQRATLEAGFTDNEGKIAMPLLRATCHNTAALHGLSAQDVVQKAEAFSMSEISPGQWRNTVNMLAQGLRDLQALSPAAAQPLRPQRWHPT